MAQVNRAVALSRVLQQPDWWREQVRDKLPLEWPQRQIRDTLLKAILDNRKYHEGGTWVVMSARQTTKNEVEAELAALILYSHCKAGGIYVRTAPTYDQITTSRDRLDAVLNACPVCNAYGGFERRAGNFTQLKWGAARLRYISTQKEASVEGATASIALSNDEFHTVDGEHYDRRIAPFKARWNAPEFNFGVASNGDDKLHEAREFNDEHHPERNLIYPADIWAEIWPDTYGRMWDDLCLKFGRDNPAIRMNFLLVPVEAVASFLGMHMEPFLTSQHTRREQPELNEMDYGMVIDLAGEEDLDSEEAVEAQMEGAMHLDSTAIQIFAVDRRLPADQRVAMILDHRTWQGKPWQLQETEISNLIQLWQPKVVVMDRRGIGQMLVSNISKRFGHRVIGYDATSDSVNDDITNLYGLLHNGRVKMHRSDGSADYDGVVKQIRSAQRVIRGAKLKVAKAKSTSIIDHAKALTYIPRALAAMGDGKIHHPQRSTAVARPPKASSVTEGFKS